MRNPEHASHPHYTVREMRLEDGEETHALLEELHVATYQSAKHNITQDQLRERFRRYTPEQRRQRLEQRLADDNEQSYVAVDGSGEIVGMVAPKIEDSGVHRLGALYVREDHHGKGVAGELMKKALAWLGAEHNRVELHVVTYNDRAKAFYRKWGFEEVPGSEALFDDLIPEVTMVRQPRRWDDETQR